MTESALISKYILQRSAVALHPEAEVRKTSEIRATTSVLNFPAFRSGEAPSEPGSARRPRAPFDALALAQDRYGEPPIASSSPFFHRLRGGS
jgi:hypothetical protein